MIVIPMAGLSRRFAEAGYDRPKYMLDLHGRTLFAHAVDSFRDRFAQEPFLFITGEVPGVRDFLDRELAALGVAQARTVVLPRPTLGQADTVRLGLQDAGVDGDTPLTVFNIDTFRPGFRYPEADWWPGADGYLEVMQGDDPGFSFVLPLDGSRVGRTAEKVVISSLASTGLYWFRRARDFLDALQDDPGAAQAKGELYVAPLYNALIARGLDIRYHQVDPADVIFCGVPAQYDALLRQEPGAGRPRPLTRPAPDGGSVTARTG